MASVKPERTEELSDQKIAHQITQRKQKRSNKSPQRSNPSIKKKQKNTILDYFKRSPRQKLQRTETKSTGGIVKTVEDGQHRMDTDVDVSVETAGAHNEALPHPLLGDCPKVSSEVVGRNLKDHEMSDGSTDTEVDVLSDQRASPTKDNRKKPEAEPIVAPVRVKRKRSRGGWARYSERDTTEYRMGYPGKRDVLSKKLNKLFYTNQIASSPRGSFIENILRDWYGDYDKLEQHHGYIQWLFPIREEGMNIQSQELQLHEAEAIRSDPEAHGRVLRAYEMMLDFFGIRLADRTTGRLERSDNWEDRYRNLRSMRHNYLRITRILKSLGELGYEHLKTPFVRFMLQEAVEERVLTSILDSALDFWVFTIKDDEQRQKLLDYANQYVEDA